MTETRFANFQDRLDGKGAAGVPPKDPDTPEIPENPDEPEGEPETDPETGKDSSMTTETPLEERDDYKAGLAAGTAAANTRMNAVFGHEATKGREAHAARLLGRSMSAEEIVAELPNFTVATTLSSDEQREAAEEGGRKEMKDALDATDTKNLGSAEEPGGKTGRAATDAVWDKANAAVGRTQKER